MKSTTSNRSFAARDAVALAALFSAGHAAAQAPRQPAPQTPEPPAANLPEVLVDADRVDTYNPQLLSSQKFTAPLLDTPQTLSIIPKEVYNQQAARTLNDILKNTPGITYDAGENGFATGAGNFGIRGFDSSGSVYVDGVRENTNAIRDIFNLERVEVSKGAASDNGRGGAGGYVNLVTKTAKLDSFYSGTASYGFDESRADSRFRTTLDINQALTGFDGAAFRFNALLEDGGVAGREHAERNGWAVAPTITFGLGTPTRFTLSYEHLERNDLPDSGAPSLLIKGMTPSGNTNHSDLSQNLRRDNFYGLLTDFDDVTSDSITATIEHDFANGFTLTNQTRWSQNDRAALTTGPTAVSAANLADGVTATQTWGFLRENSTLSNLTSFSGEFATGNLKHTLATGLEISREESESGRGFSIPASGNTNLYHPNPRRVSGPSRLNPDVTDEVTADTIAAYAYDTIEFSPQWQATFGLRAEHSRVEVESSSPDFNGDGSYKRSDSSLTGKFGLVYKPVENGSIYGSVGLSALPPGSAFLTNPDISRGNDAQSLPNIAGQQGEDAKLQKALNFEIGTKWNFCNDRITTTAALFRTEKYNIGMANTAGDFLGYGEQIVEGIELGAAGQITDEWSVFAGILLMDSERKHSSRIDRPAPDGVSEGGSTIGDQLAFTPNYSANLWTTYRFTNGLTIGGGVQYVDSSYVGRPDNVDRVISNGANGKIPDYLVFNALVQYEINENFTVRLNVDNIFDELHTTSANWSARRVQLGAPRTYTISADWKF